MSTDARRPLAGIRVLDLSKVLAGPLCAQYLADMGAEVIKVEAPGSGDDTRGWPPFRAPGMGAVFMSANRGKRSIAIDMKSDEGRAIVHEMARTCDVAIESFRTGVAERLGIDRATLQGINPRLIHCSISGFGRDGPMKNAPGYDVILQAFSGMMSLTGEAGGPHVRSPISPIDQSTGFHALSGILAALYARQATGAVDYVEVSLYETALALLGYNFQSYWERGHQPERCGSSHEALCPYQVFEATDGAVMIGVANDSLWRKFCKIAGLDDIVDDPRFVTNADRVAHRDEVLTHVKRAIGQHPMAFWDEELAKARVPCSPINDLAAVLAHPHTQQSDIVLSYAAQDGGTINSIAQPVKFGGRKRTATLPPPSLGQDSSDLLSDLGKTVADIDDLRARGIVG
ncbi:CaiB/BaiF CoA transferase family protein [Yoonia sp.]|jgi:crotonobetainyl-CoA:carnitine CoA-transferase CaiB-like acyl-CoA transferase|uniref:CaiB/BaiF CoA transferase family protein n=1 Tax=Yoonia sp. TaxID=2212373 RepID=UPI0040488BE4